jgi:AraC-like DNA-binding protein
VRPGPAFVRSSILTEYKRLALALGLDPLAFMKRAGIDRRLLEDPDLTLPMRAIVDLFDITALTSGIEDFGLRLAEARSLPDLGPAILMLREQTTVRDALSAMISLLHLHSDALYMHLDAGAKPILNVNIMVDGRIDCRQAIDTSIASSTRILRWLLGEEWTPASVSFMHARPASRARFDRFFRCPIHFLQELNGIVLRRGDLDRQLPASSPAIKRQVERYIDTLNVAASDTYVHRVTQVVAMSLPKGEARADTVARLLGTDRRTLNRRLARSSLNYSAILERVRANAAVQYLQGSDLALSDIAGLIGFNSLSAFTRWFGQSFGKAPNAWRRARRAVPIRQISAPIRQSR